MNIREAIKLAIENQGRWYEYDRGDRYPAGKIQNYDDGTIGIQDNDDGHTVIIPISLFQVAVPAPLDYACDLSRAIDACVRDARKVAMAPDQYADDGIARFGVNVVTDEITFICSEEGKTTLRVEPLYGWTTR